MQRPWGWGSYRRWLSLLLLTALVAAAACGGTTGTKERSARDLAITLSEELRAYRDNRLDADLERARTTCAEIQSEATEGRLQGSDSNSFTASADLTSACDVVEAIGMDDAARVETAISLVDLARELLE
jgi:hypothetical protein